MSPTPCDGRGWALRGAADRTLPARGPGTVLDAGLRVRDRWHRGGRWSASLAS